MGQHCYHHCQDHFCFCGGGGGYGGGGGGGSRDQGPSVFVGNIPWAATEDELTDLFAGSGNVVKFRILVDRETQRPRGKYNVLPSRRRTPLYKIFRYGFL